MTLKYTLNIQTTISCWYLNFSNLSHILKVVNHGSGTQLCVPENLHFMAHCYSTLILLIQEIVRDVKF